jgi:hypothetical protein
MAAFGPSTAWGTAAALAVLLAGCYSSYQEVADVEEDGRADEVHDVDGGDEARADADAGADAHVEADGDAVPDAIACDGTWRDPTTGYLWENPASDAAGSWDAAVMYCNALALCGMPAGSWHLPDIDELRSLIRGCPATMTGGACGVTDSCLGGDACWAEGCDGCGPVGGPGSGGCYWDGALGGPCDWWYWSSSPFAASGILNWDVSFYNATVRYNAKSNAGDVRCVHHGP